MGALPELGAFNRRNIIHFIHKVVLGNSGAISTQEAPSVSGVVATKTASETGRYTLQLPSKYRKFHGGFAVLLGPDDAVLGAKTTGSLAFLRDNDIDGGAMDGTVELQFANPSTDDTNYIDAEPANGLSFFVHLWVEL